MADDLSSLEDDAEEWARKLKASASEMNRENVGDPDLLAKGISRKVFNRELNKDEFIEEVRVIYGEDNAEDLRTVLNQYRRNSRLPRRFEISPTISEKDKWQNNWKAGFGFGEKQE